MSDKMATWLNNEIQPRNWSLRSLARRVGVSHTTVIKIANGETTPSVDMCRCFADIFGVALDEIMRIAGILPPEPPEVAEEKVALRLFRELSPNERRGAIEYLKLRHRLSRRVDQITGVAIIEG